MRHPPSKANSTIAVTCTEEVHAAKTATTATVATTTGTTTAAKTKKP